MMRACLFVAFASFLVLELASCKRPLAVEDPADSATPACQDAHPNGNGWGDPVHVAQGLEATISADDAGHVYVAYMENTGNMVDIYGSAFDIGSALSVSDDCGQTFDQVFERQDDKGFSGDVTTGASADGDAYMSWIDYEYTPNFRSSAQLIASDDHGVTWSDPTAVRDDVIDSVRQYHDRPWLTVAANGTVDLEVAEGPVSEGDEGLQSAFVRSTDGGTSWSDAILTVPNYESGFGFSAFGVVDLVGAVILTYAWYNDISSPSAVRYGTLTLAPGSSIFDTVEYGGSDDSTTKPFPTYVAEAHGDHACFTFLGGDSRGRSAVYTQSSTDGGSTFSNPVLVDEDGGRYQWMPTSTMDPLGRCQLFWLDDRDGGYRPWTATVQTDGTITDSGAIGDGEFEPLDGDYQTMGDYLVLTTTNDSRYAVWTDTSTGTTEVWMASSGL